MTNKELKSIAENARSLYRSNLITRKKQKNVSNHLLKRTTKNQLRSLRSLTRNRKQSLSFPFYDKKEAECANTRLLQRDTNTPKTQKLACML